MTDPVGALRFLLARSLANRVRIQLQRVKSPRYAFAFAVGALWLWSFLGRGMRTGGAIPPGWGPVAQILYEVLIAFTTAWLWLFGTAEPALAFSQAEVQLLFPAPLTRRALINYKLAQAQIAILFSVFVWKWLLARSASGIPVLHGAALWVLFTTLYLHRVGASFVRVGAAMRGRAGLRSILPPLSIVAAAIVAVAWTVVVALPALEHALQIGAIGSQLLALANAPAVRIVLWPFRALVTPVFAPTFDAWAASIGWAVLLLVVNYLWVVRTGVNFEEAAMQRAERVAAQRAARRTRGEIELRATQVWPPLAVNGRPAAALVWKVAVAFQRLVSVSRATILVLLVVGAIALSMPGVEFGATLLGAIMLAGAGLLVMFGPLYVRTDLQQDMLLLPLLRSYPLSGRSIVAAEITGTVALLSVMQAICLSVGLAALTPWAKQWAQAGNPARAVHAIPVLIAALLMAPAVTALRVTVANAWAVLLPGWVHLGPGRSGGIESVGQNLVSVFGSLMAHLLLLLAPAVAGMVVILALTPVAGAWAYPPAAIVASAVAAGELWFLMGWLGDVLARTDPSAVEAAAA